MGVQTSQDENGVEYRPRVADVELAALLRATRAVVVEGPRACGKTETALRAAASAVRLDVDDAARAAGLRMAERVDVNRHGRPAALVVVTGWGYGYRRPDGVCVVPVGSLGP